MRERDEWAEEQARREQYGEDLELAGGAAVSKSPEEWAQVICTTQGEVADIIRAAQEEARTEEREACAQVAEDEHLCAHVAAAIRARGLD